MKVSLWSPLFTTFMRYQIVGFFVPVHTKSSLLLSLFQCAGLWLSDVIVGRALGLFTTNVWGTGEFGMCANGEWHGREELAAICRSRSHWHEGPSHSLSFENRGWWNGEQSPRLWYFSWCGWEDHGMQSPWTPRWFNFIVLLWFYHMLMQLE